MMLETVATFPGMMGGKLLHLRSLHKFQLNGGWIKALLEEAENKRIQLTTLIELLQPKWYETYWKYTAPIVAIEYWRFPKDATLKDIITNIWSDEAHHRDVNLLLLWVSVILHLFSGFICPFIPLLPIAYILINTYLHIS